jgi:hypothetical protein
MGARRQSRRGRTTISAVASRSGLAPSPTQCDHCDDDDRDDGYHKGRADHVPFVSDPLPDRHLVDCRTSARGPNMSELETTVSADPNVETALRQAPHCRGVDEDTRALVVEHSVTALRLGRLDHTKSARGHRSPGDPEAGRVRQMSLPRDLADHVMGSVGDGQHRRTPSVAVVGWCRRPALRILSPKADRFSSGVRATSRSGTLVIPGRLRRTSTRWSAGPASHSPPRATRPPTRSIVRDRLCDRGAQMFAVV